MDNDSLAEVVGFDLGDSETACAKVSARRSMTQPEEIFCSLAKSDNGVIKTVVGYTRDNEILVGRAAAASPNLRPDGLKVGFKRLPSEDDHEYAELVTDFVDAVVRALSQEKLVDLPRSKVVVGYPSKWKSIDAGRPVEVLDRVLQQTKLQTAGAVTLVPESRGAMVEAVYSGMFDKPGSRLTRSALEGWALVVDVGSSTTDFTAVNLGSRTAEPVDLGEELGARLIDRAIVEHAIKAAGKDEVEGFFAGCPEERARFELACREFKEDYYAGQEIERDYVARHAGRKLLIEVSLTHAVMRHLTTEVPVANLSGQPVSWQSALGSLLQLVRATLEGRGAWPVTAVVLAGGASRMGFVRAECERVFPEVGAAIAQSSKPQYTVAYGLARWGRIQIQTDRFAEAVTSFCDKNVVPCAEKMADQLLTAIPAVITGKILDIVKGEFLAWRTSGHATINDMNKAIRASIETWLNDGLPAEIENTSRALLVAVGKAIEADVKEIENRFGIPIGTLGSAVASSTLVSHRVRTDVSLGTDDVTDGAADALGNLIGVISGIVVGVVMLNVVPIVLVIVVKVVLAFSITLAGMIATPLIAHPFGWPILIAAGLAMAAGVGVKEMVQDAIPGINLPGWVRRMANPDKINAKLEARRPEIDGEIRKQFDMHPDLRKTIINDTAAFYRKRLTEKCEDARMLIT